MADETNNGHNRDPRRSDVGSETDVEKVAETITPRQIWAITVAGEPFTSRQQRLREMIEELRARIAASERGKDLEPLLKEAEDALGTIEARQADEENQQPEEGRSNAGRKP